MKVVVTFDLNGYYGVSTADVIALVAGQMKIAEGQIQSMRIDLRSVEVTTDA